MSENAAILLVDDREENLIALEAVLAPLGHHLVRADSGIAALRELLRHDFACILLDVDMPELDGFETARLIKQRARSRHVPILFVTALPEDDRAVFHGYSVGAVDYIFKPIDPDILRSKVGVFVELWDKNRLFCARQELLASRSGDERDPGEGTARGRDAADRVARGRERNRHVFQPPLVRVHRDHSRRRPAGSPWSSVVHVEDLPGVAVESEARATRDSRHEVAAACRERDDRWHLRSHCADPRRARPRRVVGGYGDRHRRPQAGRAAVELPARGRRHARDLARLSRDALAGGAARRRQGGAIGAPCTSSSRKAPSRKSRSRIVDPAQIVVRARAAGALSAERGRADRGRRR